MSSAAVGTAHSSGPLSLMSCVRESSPLQDDELDGEKCNNVTTKRKFWNPKKWFKRKQKIPEENVLSSTIDISEYTKDLLRSSRSTSELSITDEPSTKRRSGSMHPGLSVSHDSVFHSPNSGSDIELDAAQSSSSLSISQPQVDLRLQTELSERLRLRRNRGDFSEDDEGLPHSPSNSPTTTDGNIFDKTTIKDLPTKSHSTCSDGSLLSMGSSEIDEESFSQQSRHSSKLSLYDKNKCIEQDSDLELSTSSIAPLNHSAAHHRVAVRPKRRAPRRNRVPQLSTALPTTPEVNEESTTVRCATPEILSKDGDRSLSEIQLKCSSLPPGLTPPIEVNNKLNRSRSNASSASKSQEQFTTLQEDDDEKDDKTDKSFFDRLFPRRSAKKKKLKEEKQKDKKNDGKLINVNNATKCGAATRQRIQPIDIPVSPLPCKRDCDKSLSSDNQIFINNSPLHMELENHFKQFHSPNLTNISVIPRLEYKIKSEEIRNKTIIPGLSSLQQRVLFLNNDDDDCIDNGFKSLTDLPDDSLKTTAKLVTKSHSFKSTKATSFDSNIKEPKFSNLEKSKRSTLMAKAASLDSIKQLDEISKKFHEIEKQQTEIENNVSNDRNKNAITISGPSHTAIVNISNNNDKIEINCEELKEAVSITKIQLKRETTQITQSTVTVPKNVVPEFLSRQLNKVEIRPASNIVLSMNSKIDDQLIRPKTLNLEQKLTPRKFSKEDIEIIDKDDEQKTARFQKNVQQKKTPESMKKQFAKNRSISLDSLKSDLENSESSEDSLDKLDKEKITMSYQEPVILRKKSQITKKRNDEEPELMKVFARRSLKLKDNESEIISEQVTEMMEEDNKIKDNSDKENQIDSPKEERKKNIISKTKEPLVECKPEEQRKSCQTTKEVINETKFIETSEVVFRKPILSNNFYPYQRTININNSQLIQKNNDVDVKKQFNIGDNNNLKKTTDNWISNNIIENNKKISQDEMIKNISQKSELITNEIINETKNFNQRKAEWEKRAQEAQKKSVP